MAAEPRLGTLWTRAIKQASGSFLSGALLSSACFIFALWAEKIDEAWQPYYQWIILAGFAVGILLMVVAAVKSLFVG